MKKPIYDGTNEDECEYYDNVIMELPTFEEWTENMSLTDQIKFYYDVDVINPYTRESNFIGDPWEILAKCAVDPHWLEEFKVNFKEYLQEREYIR